MMLPAIARGADGRSYRRRRQLGYLIVGGAAVARAEGVDRAVVVLPEARPPLCRRPCHGAAEVVARRGTGRQLGRLHVVGRAGSANT